MLNFKKNSIKLGSLLVEKEIPLEKNMTTVTVTLSLQLLCQLIGSNPASPNHSICNTNGSVPHVEIVSTRLPQGYIAYPDIGIAYKVYDDIVSWKVAMKQCQLDGGQLALIDSYTKLQYARSQRKSQQFTHVGILRMYDEEEWIGLSTGLPVTVIPWAENEPSGSTDCVMIKNNENGLANYKCSSRGDYICELPNPRNYIIEKDSIVDQLIINQIDPE